MLVMVVPPVLAGLLGLVASGAVDSEAYLSRLRLLMIGAILLGYLGVAIWTFRKEKGVSRWICIGVALVFVRIAYLFIPFGCVIITGWIEGIAGQTPSAGMVHYSMGLFAALIATIVAVAGVVTVIKIKRMFIVAILMGALGIFEFWDAEDRTLSPHPFRKSARAPAMYGDSYRDVLKDKERPKRTRMLAAVSVAIDATMPSEGWIGAVKSEMEARFKADPEMGINDRLTALEASLLKARSYLQTSPRTPPASSGRRPPGRS